jgi:Zn-finger nucleic acid-binding protein
VKIDECPEHGIWLDTGEIKDLQIFVEKHMQRR